MNKTQGKELLKVHEMEKSPISIIETEEGFFTCIGMNRLSNALPTMEEAEKDAERDDWERRMVIIGIIVEAWTKQNETTKTRKEYVE